MNGFKISVYRITDKEGAETYNREQAEQVYEQRVSDLDLQALIAVVNNLQAPSSPR